RRAPFSEGALFALSAYPTPRPKTCLSDLRVFNRPVRQPRNCAVVDSGGADEQAEGARIALVVNKRLTECVRYARTCFTRYQRGGRNIPFETPAQGSHQIGTVVGNHSNPQRDRLGFFNYLKILILLHQGVGRDPGAGEPGPFAGRDRPPVEPCTLPCRSRPE